MKHTVELFKEHDFQDSTLNILSEIAKVVFSLFCRSRRKPANDVLPFAIGVDRTENGPSKVWDIRHNFMGPRQNWRVDFPFLHDAAAVLTNVVDRTAKYSHCDSCYSRVIFIAKVHS